MRMSNWAVTEPKWSCHDDPKKRSNGWAGAEGRQRALRSQLYRKTVTRASRGGKDVILLAVATDTKREALARSLSPYLVYASRLVWDRE